MALRALIVDDEQLAREELKYLLSQEAAVEVCGESSNGIEAVQMIQESAPDLVFLDVQMPGMDGFGVLRKLLARKNGTHIPQVVFATAFDQYAVRAFEVNAVDYLLKPYDKKRLHQAVEKAERRKEVTAEAANAGATPATPATQASVDALLKFLEQQSAPQPQGARGSQKSRVVLRAQGRLLLVDQKDICFASIEEGTISVMTPTMEGHSNHRTLEDLLDTLDPAVFWRAHRSYVVNINHIREVVPWFKSSYQLRMNDRRHSEIPVSRAQTRRLRELFNL